VLYALREQGPVSDRLRELLAEPLGDDALVAEALELLRGSGALKQAMSTLHSYADRARAELAVLPDCAARDALASLTDYLMARTG
jgi:heptaprenyl diphosphate synthase